MCILECPFSQKLLAHELFVSFKPFPGIAFGQFMSELDLDGLWYCVCNLAWRFECFLEQHCAFLYTHFIEHFDERMFNIVNAR